ncbi:MAG: hypothetical protein DME23_02925 [Verrucomicrobia bacterium]|nr:MAG: hypothetical protein DME23_02925 [Verrucomicrobiota bacterium]
MIKRGSLFHTSDGYGGSPPESDQAIVRFAMKTPNLSPEKNALLEQRLGVAAQARAKGIVIPRRTNQDPAPLSFAQRQMWVIDQMSPGNPAYNLPIGYRLKGPLDLTALENSFNEVIKRHEALRTTFAVQDGEPLQFIHSDFKIKITITDLSHLTGEECENRLQALASEESVKSFDLSRLPLIRVSLFKLDETEHVLIINLHHTVADGLSTALLLNEVDMFYRAFTEGGEPHPRELTVQYADFALWQHRTMADEAAYARKTEFWRKQLGGSLPILQLPSDKSRPTFQSFKGSNVFFNIPAALTQDLRSLGAREERTFFTIVLAAFQVLLHRYSGAEDIIIGTPVAARTPAELEPLIGLILNMVPLRCDLSDDPAFIDLLRRTGDTVLDAFSNDLPLEVVMKHLKFERDPSRNPIFQVALQVLSTNTCRIGYLDVSSFDFDLKFAPFDLTLHLYEDSGGYHGRFQYCTDLFHPETIQRLSQNFVHLLHAIVREPDQRISALPILTDGERQQVLVDWNQTTVDYPRNRCIHELFETQAKCTPDAVALEYEGLRLTYGELNARANQIARYLARHGVGPETMVGICVERSLEMVAAILGILKAGGAYVPLDPDYPASRLSFMLEDTGAPVLLTQAKLRDKLPPYAGRTVALDADWPQIANEPQDDLNFGVNARNLAYVIYTSGSTGRPKGTCIEHRSVVRLVKSVDYIELGPQEVFLQFAPISFDASTLELWGSLLNGAKLVVCPAGLPSLEQLGRVIQERGVTTLWLTASLFHQMVDEQIESLRGVRQLLAGGETLSVPHVRRMLEVLGNNRLINGYGPTENTTFTCCHVMTSQSRIEQTVPIGRPISNTRVYVLDRYMQPVPIGAYGELYIGGDGLAREYLHQPELTTEKFVSDPFGSEAGARLYRTGDLVRFRTDGCIEFLGRIDHQVKIRGYRIELGEIETSIAQHSAVREVAVIAREDTPGDKRLVAYLVAPNPPSGFVDQLRTLLRASLPQYMMPAAFVLLDAFPITPNGKLDRNALPAPEVTAYATRGYEVPLGEIETRLAQIWSDVLKVERVGRHDHFFDLGGHSLLAVSVIERMRREGLHADVRALFATPTLAALAAAVGGDSSIVDVPPNRIPPGCDAITPEMLPLVQLTSDDIEHIVSAVPGGAANIQDIYPLAPLQEGILFHHLMSTEGDPYLLSASYAFDSQARLERYLQAVQSVVDRHDILRTAVLWEGLPEPVQVVCRQARVVVEVVSLEPGAGDAAQQLSARFDPRHYRLDVRQAPMLRIFIAHDAANARWVMLQLFHHLSIDHTAQEVMQQEIQAHLLGQAAQLPTPLPFRNFVTQARLGVSREEHEAFFQKLLGDVDEPTAPFGLIDVQGDGSGIAEARRPIDAPLARRLRERARALGVSAASVCHLAWAQVLARVSGRDDVVFGTLL